MVTRLAQIAKVALNSPLPQLDRLFDYAVPEHLVSTALPGVRVRVPFGRSKNQLDGYIVEIAQESDFEGKLSEIAEVISSARVLDSDVYQLCRAVADRQASSVADVFRLAIPDRSVAVEKKWLESFLETPNSLKGSSKRETALINPVIRDSVPVWVNEVVEAARDVLQRGGSTIIALPDFRDQSLVLTALHDAQLSDHVVDYSSSVAKSKRYSSFLSCLSREKSIVVGSRAVIYAPVRNLVQVIIWDDADSSHQEPSSPYSHTREVALLRQQIQQCDLKIFGHARSAEIARYLNLNFFTDSTKAFPIPKIANSDSDIRVDSLAWRAIRSGLEQGAVLVQVASKGTSSSAYCNECNSRAMCKSCNGPIWIDQRNMTRCRWCNAGNLDHTCKSCGSAKLRQGKPGSSRTVAEFGKAFPGARIIESTGDEPVLTAPDKSLVIATPGAEPLAKGGYTAVIILDANVALSKDSLRATEDAVRSWANAIALMHADGRAVVVGLAGTLATKFSLWSMAEIANHELATRTELRFPPAIRLASVGTTAELMQEVLPEVSKIAGVEILGPISITDKGTEVESRVLLKFEYSTGLALAEAIRALSLKISAGHQRFSAKSGRAMRPIRVKMDDQEVI